MATASTRRSCVTSGWTEHAIVAVSVLLRMALMSCAGDVLAGLRLLSDNPIMQADRAAFFQRLSAFMMGGRMPLFFFVSVLCQPLNCTKFRANADAGHALGKLPTESNLMAITLSQRPGV